MSQMVGPQRRQAVVPNVNTLSSYVVSDGSIGTNLREVLTENNCIDLGYYLHRTKLGEGGFGKVRLATHLKTGHKVAVKIMDKKKLGSDLCRVRVEINSLKVLRHENIAKLLQVIETINEIYLILEHCSGGELFDYLVSKSKLKESEAKIIMKDLANALAYIHSNGFAHRDLKPENILFDGNHRIKLIDFGLAAHSRDNNNSLNHLKTCCGSPAYAAPELLVGPSYSGPAVDVWSAGILLFALLVGRLPFDDDNIPNLYKKIQSGVFHMPLWLSSDAKHLIQLMLKTNPRERITIEQMLSHPWLNTCNDTKSGKTSVQIMKPNIDENVLFQCHILFPETPIKDLRQNILQGFGYQTAAYWLIKMNGSSIELPKTNAINSPLNETNRRRSKSLSQSVNNENENHQNVRKINEMGNIHKPKVAAILWGTKTAPNSPQTSKLSKIPIPSPKPKDGHKLKEIKSPNNSPLIPPKKARLFDGVNHNMAAKSPDFRTQKTFSPNSKTPNNKIESTPKKSLFKRFLETATPAKSQTPRAITTATTTKNITLTNFSEPQKCIDKLIETLSAKNIVCKQRDYCLRCVLSTNNTIVLSFNLEICKYQNKCVIQRKRLKGDAWNYKKVCEEILRISNE